MVFQLIKACIELDNVETLEFPEDHEWCVDVFLPGSGEVRENVVLSRSEDLEIPNSRGTANVVIKVDKNIYATIKIEDVPKVTTRSISAADAENGKYVPLLGVDCRGCELKAWKPTGFYTATSPDGKVFDEVDLQNGEWYDVDPETNLPVSVMSIKSQIDVYRR